MLSESQMVALVPRRRFVHFEALKKHRFLRYLFWGLAMSEWLYRPGLRVLRMQGQGVEGSFKMDNQTIL